MKDGRQAADALSAAGDAGRQGQRQRSGLAQRQDAAGYVQGYNAQAVCNERQLVVAAEINADSPDFGQLDPMVSAAERELAGAGVAEAPAVVVADAGYWHHDQMDALAAAASGC
jgi:hypothetical protein